MHVGWVLHCVRLGWFIVCFIGNHEEIDVPWVPMEGSQSVFHEVSVCVTIWSWSEAGPSIVSNRPTKLSLGFQGTLPRLCWLHSHIVNSLILLGRWRSCGRWLWFQASHNGVLWSLFEAYWISCTIMHNNNDYDHPHHFYLFMLFKKATSL